MNNPKLEQERRKIEKELSDAGISGADKITIRGYEHFNVMIEDLNRVSTELDEGFVVYYADDESDDGTI